MALPSTLALLMTGLPGGTPKAVAFALPPGHTPLTGAPAEQAVAKSA